MNQYEGLFIISSALDANTLRKAVADVSDILTREGGKIVSVEEWGRRKLAYMVQKHHEGYYILVNFDLAPDKIARVRSLYILNEQVIRFILLKRVPKQEITDKPREEARYETSFAA